MNMTVSNNTSTSQINITNHHNYTKKTIQNIFSSDKNTFNTQINNYRSVTPNNYNSNNISNKNNHYQKNNIKKNNIPIDMTKFKQKTKVNS